MFGHLVKGHALSIKRFKEALTGKLVVVYGAGPSLPANFDALVDSRPTESCVHMAADGASTLLLEKGVLPHVVVTDLDGALKSIFRCGENGSIIVVHAHGDNIGNIITSVPRMRDFKLLGTTQVKPTSTAYNFGGFTDGDRCVFIAEALGAKEVWLVGMDFGNVIGRYSKPYLTRDVPATPVKQAKLKFASELIRYLSIHSTIRIRNLTTSP